MSLWSPPPDATSASRILRRFTACLEAEPPAARRTQHVRGHPQLPSNLPRQMHQVSEQSLPRVFQSPCHPIDSLHLSPPCPNLLAICCPLHHRKKATWMVIIPGKMLKHAENEHHTGQQQGVTSCRTETQGYLLTKSRESHTAGVVLTTVGVRIETDAALQGRDGGLEADGRGRWEGPRQCG